MHAQQQHVYIASNPSRPGTLKVGCTRRPIGERIPELGGECSEEPDWELVAVLPCRRAKKAEALTHLALCDHKVPHPRRKELFRVSPDAAIAAARAAIAMVERSLPAAETQPETLNEPTRVTAESPEVRAWLAHPIRLAGRAAVVADLVVEALRSGSGPAAKRLASMGAQCVNWDETNPLFELAGCEW